MAKKPKKRIKRPGIDLDSKLKRLFLVKSFFLSLVNLAFGTRYPEKSTLQVRAQNTEFVPRFAGDALLRADLVIDVSNDGISHTYHIEFQTAENKNMYFRMMEYGLRVASSMVDENHIIFRIPNQCVLYPENNGLTGNLMQFTIEAPSKEKVTYSVPVIRLWQISQEEMRQKNYYALMALYPFTLRKEIRDMRSSNRAEEEKTERITALFAHLAEALEEMFTYLDREVREKRISREDADVVMSVYDGLTRELYQAYEGFVTYTEGGKSVELNYFTNLGKAQDEAAIAVRAAQAAAAQAIAQAKAQAEAAIAAQEEAAIAAQAEKERERLEKERERLEKERERLEKERERLEKEHLAKAIELAVEGMPLEEIQRTLKLSFDMYALVAKVCSKTNGGSP